MTGGLEKEKMVKGTMLVDYVRLIRAQKETAWEKYLTKEDLEIVKGRIFPAGWYPYKTFQRCGLAVLREIANNDLGIVRQWGRVTMKNLIEKTYPQIKRCNNIFDAFQSLQAIRNRFFNFVAPFYEKAGPKSVRIILEGAPNEEGVKPFCYQVVGNYDYLIEEYGGKNVQVVWEKKTWEGDDSTSFVLTWE
jgi:hypothetical protein